MDCLQSEKTYLFNVDDKDCQACVLAWICCNANFAGMQKMTDTAKNELEWTVTYKKEYLDAIGADKGKITFPTSD